MEVRNCKGCGRLFNVINREVICPDCVRKLEDKFQEVKAYLEEYPNSSVDAVSSATGASVKQIRKWVKEERLILSEGAVGGIVCEQCGKPIRTGRFCDGCKANISNNLHSAFDKPKAPTSKKSHRERDRMRFLQN